MLDTVTNEGLTWMNIEKPTHGIMEKLLESGYHFHELNIEDCISKIQIPKVCKYADHIFIVFHFTSSSAVSVFLMYWYFHRVG
jgi:magnesium transporter